MARPRTSPTTAANVNEIDINVNETYKYIGDRIWTIRKSRGYSQGDLAEHLGLSRVAVGTMEAGKQNISIVTMLIIARFLHVPLIDLLPTSLLPLVLELPTNEGLTAEEIARLRALISEKKAAAQQS